MAGTEPETRRRGRPPRPDHTSRRRAELIDAAYEVFAERGYTAAGVADIAEKLGIGHGTFYRYFESKREVFDHVVDRLVERILAEMLGEQPPDAARSLADLDAQVRGNVDRLLALLNREPGIVRVILFESTSVDAALTGRLLALMDAFAAITAAYLENGIRRGFVRSDIDVQVTAEAINALLVPGLRQALRGDFDAEKRGRYLDGMLDFIGRGIGVHGR